jgi:hypothetical protein
MVPPPPVGATPIIAIKGQASPAASILLAGMGVAPTGGGGTITYLQVESGAYNTNTATFSNPSAPMLTTWDTDNSTTNRVVGVSLPDVTSPLFNQPLPKQGDGSPGKTINIPQGPSASYYTYYHPFGWQQDMRVTVGWSDGRTDVGYFHVAGFGANQQWPYVGPSAASSRNWSVTYKTSALPAVFRVHDNVPLAGGAANDVLLLTITR